MTTAIQEKKGQVFKHRFDETQANDITHVVDSIGLMTDRASGVLHLLFAQFDSGVARYSDELLQGAIDSVIADINDIDSVLRSHWEALKSEGKASSTKPQDSQN